jgi:hypothetical protein
MIYHVAGKLQREALRETPCCLPGHFAICSAAAVHYYTFVSSLCGTASILCALLSMPRKARSAVPKGPKSSEKPTPKNPPLHERGEIYSRYGIRLMDRKPIDSPFEPWLHQIEKLGDIKFESYGARAERSVKTQPWMMDLYKKADAVSSLASDLSGDESVNEATWRFTLEHLLFDRFTEEVTW